MIKTVCYLFLVCMSSTPVKIEVLMTTCASDLSPYVMISFAILTWLVHCLYISCIRGRRCIGKVTLRTKNVYFVFITHFVLTLTQFILCFVPIPFTLVSEHLSRHSVLPKKYYFSLSPRKSETYITRGTGTNSIRKSITSIILSYFKFHFRRRELFFTFWTFGHILLKLRELIKFNYP